MPTYGRDAVSSVLMRDQTDFRTQAAPGAAKFVRLPAYEYVVDATRELIDDKVLGDGRDPGAVLLGFERWSATLVVPMRSETLGWHLKSFFGTAPATTGGSAPYSHVWESGGPMVHRTLGRQAGAVHFADIGATWNEMRFRLARAAEAQRLTFGLIGCREVKLGAVLDATPVEPTDDRKMLAYRGALTLGGAAVAEVVDLDFTVSQGRAPDEEAISGDPYALRALEGDFTVTGSARFRFEDAALYDAAQASTERDMAVEWTSGTHSVKFEIANVIFEKSAPPLQGGGVITLTQRFRAAKPNGVGEKSMKVTVVNGRSGYAAP
jgi:hypothetical protein